MATGVRLRSNFLDGVLSAAVTNVATTMTSAEFANLPTVVLDDAYIPIVVGNEVMYVTEHAASSTTVTVERGTEGTATAAHDEGSPWEHAPTTKDVNEGFTPLASVASSGVSTEIDVTRSTAWRVTLDNDCTFSFTGTTSEEVWSITLFLIQDATGGRTVTWPASVLWNEGTPPTLSTTASSIDVLTFMTYDGGATWMGFLAGMAMA